MIDLTAPTAMLVDQLVTAATEKGILIASDAPDAELHNVQAKIDMLQAEVFRRTAW